MRSRALLVLQYPDPDRGRTVALAATRNPVALQAFRSAVMTEAREACADDDEVLEFQDHLELERLQRVFNMVLEDECPE